MSARFAFGDAPSAICRLASDAGTGPPGLAAAARSEEHTSELQSQSNLVCRLLLEKKKTHRRPPHRQALGGNHFGTVRILLLVPDSGARRSAFTTLAVLLLTPSRLYMHVSCLCLNS